MFYAGRRARAVGTILEHLTLSVAAFPIGAALGSLAVYSARTEEGSRWR